MKYTQIIKYTILTFACLFAWEGIGQSTKLKVALDAGHGGKDFGATRNYLVEKNVALDVVLKVGKILENTSGIEVIYTRKSDEFIDLIDRANTANRADADIFISLHCNSNANTEAYGTETYILGAAKNASNLETARRENAVILLEKDYKETYPAYNSNAADMMLGLPAAQEKYTDNSIALATKIENNFTDHVNRKSRGVKQGPFMLLQQVFMPGVLIELGFISNTAEGAFLESEKGQQEMARAIADAIIAYKKDIHNESTTTAEKASSKVVERATEPVAQNTPKTEFTPTKTVDNSVKRGVVFKVQISASGKKLDLTPENFKGLTNLSVSYDGGTLYKYMYGETDDYDVAKRNLSEAKAKGFEGAYLVAFRDGQKITLNEALKQ
jgi:N-acetylmuramoyl-L-alanine amidase